MTFFNQYFQAILDAQNVFEQVTLWVSPAVRRSFMRPYSDAAGFKGGTVEQYITQFGNGRIGKIGTNFLLTGNHFVGYVRNDMYIRPRVAQPVSTYAAARANPHDNFNFLVWSALASRFAAILLASPKCSTATERKLRCNKERGESPFMN